MLYLISALVLPGLHFFQLALIVLLLGAGLHQRIGVLMRLAWRTRWLFLLLGLGYAYSLPGPSLLPVLADYAPSQTGVLAGALQMLRLLILLWLLDGLVVSMGQARIMAGLYGLLRPLRGLGLSAERTTVRLALTMQAMESNAVKLKDFSLQMLADRPDQTEPGRYALTLEPWRMRDSGIVAAALLTVLARWFV